jgi:hypothetical protein
MARYVTKAVHFAYNMLEFFNIGPFRDFIVRFVYNGNKEDSACVSAALTYRDAQCILLNFRYLTYQHSNSTDTLLT